MLCIAPSILPPFDRSLLTEMGFDNHRYAEIESLDGTKLSLLHVPVDEPADASRGTVLLIHGLGDRKESYLDHAAQLRELGYETVLLDLRGHGKSGGKMTTMGYRESEDIRAAARWVLEGWVLEGGVLEGGVLEGGVLERESPRPLIGWGISLGGTAALLAAATHDPAFDGLIVESPFGSLDETAAHHAWLLYRIPRFPVVPLVLTLFGLRTGVDAEKVDAYEAAAALGDVPVLFVAGGADPRMPPEHVQRLVDTKPGESEFLVVPEADHGHVYGTDTDAYMREVARLLERIEGG